jgi:hypothetical protein
MRGFFLLLLLILAIPLLSACLPGNLKGTDPCNEEGTLLNDDFSGEKQCGWVLYNRSGASAGISDGLLRLSTGQPGQIWWTNPGRNFDDVIMTVEAQQVSGPDDNAYGAICRYQSPQNFYVFLISGDGYYAIGKYQSGSSQIQYLSGEGEFVPSDAIRTGVAANDLRVSCIGNELSLAVNGVPLVTVTDPTFVTGDIGLAASTFQPGTTVIAFDSIVTIAP